MNAANTVGSARSIAVCVSSPPWTTYFNVAETDSTAAKAVELGATLPTEPGDTPFGRMAVIRGPQGETFAIIQAASNDSEELSS